ncbi:MAG: AraC family transcriptional regulator [Thermoleophilaceae bacterium]|nr:AraC family transcriptional regulator [Thermoleophilaceae bacterium]
MAVEVAPSLRVIRHESEHDRWELVFGNPDPRLRAYVVHYCAYDEETSTFTRRIEAPALRAPLIFNFGPPIAVCAPRAEVSDWRLLDDGLVAGLYDTYALVESSGSQSGVEVYLTPVGARLVLGMPMRHLKGQVITLDECFGALAGLVREQLLEAASWDERFSIVDSFLLPRVAAAEPPPPSLTWALSRLHATNGVVDIGSLTDELRCSRRYLIGLFNDHVGLPPKLYARILRFRHALELAGGYDGMGWAEIAHRSGYYDQAHMVRDFQQFTGHSPTDYQRLTLPDSGGVVGD